MAAVLATELTVQSVQPVQAKRYLYCQGLFFLVWGKGVCRKDKVGESLDSLDRQKQEQKQKLIIFP